MANDRVGSFMIDLISQHALAPDQRAQVDIDSRERGGIGGRGFRRNALGLEVGWWVHPERYRKEIEVIHRQLQLSGCETVLTLGCGPAFHEIVLAREYPGLSILATDFDPREIETAAKLARWAKVPNISFDVLDASAAGREASPEVNESFDRVMSLAALHDVGDVRQTFATVSRLLAPTGLFLFTYNPGRRLAQFPGQPPLEELLDQYLTLVHAAPLISAEDALEYYGEVESRSRRERGYGIVQELRVAIPRRSDLAV